MPKISVIVPVYKVEDYLDRCVESILNQTYWDFELILVDDGSPDACPTMCDEWAKKDSRIKVLHKENGGLSDARNAGFAVAEGEWITFIDSDDYVHPKMLEALYGAVMAHGVQVASCGFIRTGGEPLAEKPDLTVKLWTAKDFYLKRQVDATIACAKLYHKGVVLPYPKGKLHEDEYVTYRILFECGAVAVIDAPLYGYYQNPESITTSSWSPRRLDVLTAFLQQIAFFKENGYKECRRLRERICLENAADQLYCIEQIEDSSRYRREQATLKKTGRIVLAGSWRNPVVSLKKDAWLVARFYPGAVWLYTVGKVILRKLKRG